MALDPSFESGILGTGFEDGTTGWVFPITAYRAGYSSSAAYTGLLSGRIGIDLPADDRYSYSSAWQRFTIPSNADETTFRFNLSFLSTEPYHAANLAAFISKISLIKAPATYGTQYVILYDADTGVRIKDLLPPNWSNDTSWRNYSFTFYPGDPTYDLNSLKNRNIKLLFGVYNDTGGGASAMYVDEVYVGKCK